MSKSKFETHAIELSNEELSSAQGGLAATMPPVDELPVAPQTDPTKYYPYVPENDIVKMLRELLEKTRKQAAAAGG